MLSDGDRAPRTPYPKVHWAQRGLALAKDDVRIMAVTPCLPARPTLDVTDEGSALHLNRWSRLPGPDTANKETCPAYRACETTRGAEHASLVQERPNCASVCRRAKSPSAAVHALDTSAAKWALVEGWLTSPSTKAGVSSATWTWAKAWFPLPPTVRHCRMTLGVLPVCSGQTREKALTEVG